MANVAKDYFLKEFRVQHYGSFSEPVTFEFATPKGLPGSGLTLISGINDDARKSVINILRKVEPGSSFRKPGMHPGREPKLELVFQDKDNAENPFKIIVRRKKPAGGLSQLTKRWGQQNYDAVRKKLASDGGSSSEIPDPDFMYIGWRNRNYKLRPGKYESSIKPATSKLRSRKCPMKWQTKFEKQNPSQNVQGAIHRFKNARENLKDELLLNALHEAWLNEGYRKSFAVIMEQFLPDFRDWALEIPKKNSFSISIDIDIDFPPLPLITFETYIHACLHLIETDEEKGMKKIDAYKQSILLIDHPAGSLGSRGAKGLADIISEMSKHRQVIVSTNERSMFEWQDYINGTRLILCLEQESGKTYIEQLKSENAYSQIVDKKNADWMSREEINRLGLGFMSARGIIFVTSDESRQIIVNWAKKFDLPKNVIIHNTDGYDRMKFFLAMAADMNIKKVIALCNDDAKSLKALQANQEFFGHQAGWQFMELATNAEDPAKMQNLIQYFK